MVRLTPKYVQKIQKISKCSDKTHLYANNKQLDEIVEDFRENIPKVTVIYLHNNLLTTAANLCFANNLTHLYLQWNKISSLNDFHDLPNLTNLYLGHNHIGILNGPTRIPRLRVLHVQKQKLPTTLLCFSIKAQIASMLSISLLELNVSGNNITSLAEFLPLRKLINLDVSDNLIANVNEVCNTVRALESLKTLRIKKNPLEKNKKYEYDIVASSSALTEINGRTIPKSSRVFMQTLKLIKIQQDRKKEKVKKIEFSSETKRFVQELPLEFQEIVSGSSIHNNH